MLYHELEQFYKFYKTKIMVSEGRLNFNDFELSTASNEFYTLWSTCLRFIQTKNASFFYFA